MLGWFRKKSPPRDLEDMAAQSTLSRFTPFRAHVYEQKKLPGPGAQSYAYENLGLVEFSPIGPAVANRRFIRPLQPAALFAAQGYWFQGIYGVTGGLYSAPLIAPSALSSENAA